MRRKELAAGMLAITIVTGSVAVPGITVYAAQESDDKKEEVVYIMTTADGDIDNVNVVNIFGKGNITDYGNYSSVKMLNTTDDINKSGDKITFNTDKDKVYYQGTLENAQIPWNILITYTLDGKRILPSELAGKSGALSINIKIEKNDKCTTDFYDSYTLQAAFTLDTDKCKNIKADGATLANVGADKQISYTILPGKGLDATVSADVTDFEMDAVTINGIKLNLNVDVDDAELMSKVTQIINASKEINDASAKLSDGTSQLADGGSSLSDGVKSMNSGVNSLNEGINSMSNGVTSMQNALNALNSQSETLTNGSEKMYESLKTIQTQLSKVSVSTEQLKQLTDNSAAIRQSISDIYDGAVNLQKSLSYDSYKAAMKKGGLDIDGLQTENTQAINSLTEQINKMTALAEQLKSIPGYENNETYKAQVAQLEEQINNLNNVIKLLNGNNAAINGTSQYFNSASEGAYNLITGIGKLKSSYETFDAAINNLSTTLSGMVLNMSALKSGIDQLVESYKSLDTGINDYTDGVASVVAAYSQLVTGTNTLTAGSSQLVKGADVLRQGTDNLYQGILSVNSGAEALNSGTNEFYQQTNGMDEKIENGIDDTLKTLSGGDSKTVSFVSDKNENVSSVQFVIKTSAIKKPEEVNTTQKQETKTNFWEKLLKLFGL